MAKNKGHKISLLLLSIVLSINLETPLAFLIMVVICSLKFSKGSTYTPRSLVDLFILDTSGILITWVTFA